MHPIIIGTPPLYITTLFHSPCCPRPTKAPTPSSFGTSTACVSEILAHPCYIYHNLRPQSLLARAPFCDTYRCAADQGATASMPCLTTTPQPHRLHFDILSRTKWTPKDLRCKGFRYPCGRGNKCRVRYNSRSYLAGGVSL